MFAELAMDHSACKEVWLRWRKFDDLVEIIKRPPRLAQLAPDIMPFEISVKISRIFLQPSIYDFKETLRIGAAKPVQCKYLFRCGSCTGVILE
jgi:hypothetical protein